jgi:hypothetical protein
MQPSVARLTAEPTEATHFLPCRFPGIDPDDGYRVGTDGPGLRVIRLGKGDRPG